MRCHAGEWPAIAGSYGIHKTKPRAIRASEQRGFERVRGHRGSAVNVTGTTARRHRQGVSTWGLSPTNSWSLKDKGSRLRVLKP